MLENTAIKAFVITVSSVLLLFVAVFLVRQAAEVAIFEDGAWRFAPFAAIYDAASMGKDRADIAQEVAPVNSDKTPHEPKRTVAVANTPTQKSAPKALVANPVMSVSAIGTFYNNSFIPKSPLSTSERIGVRVEVVNQGSGATDTWMVGFTLPDGTVRHSVLQSPLQAGERAFVVVDFMISSAGSYQIPVVFISGSNTAASRSAIATVSVN